jgi:hypothetical protein
MICRVQRILFDLYAFIRHVPVLQLRSLGHAVLRNLYSERNTLFALLPILATFPVTLLFVILEGNLMDDASAGYANVLAIACWYEDSENRGPESVSALSLCSSRLMHFVVSLAVL